jgi:hypothetical protein
LAELPQLSELHLLGVRPADKRIDDLLLCPALTQARLSKYPKQEQRLNRFLDERSQAE